LQWRSAQQGADASQQFGESKGLDQVIIRTDVKTFNAIVYSITGGK
jgi:hypothetical protein